MRLHALQYLRALAALAVVYHHVAAQVPRHDGTLPAGGAFGVDVFFVISGFIMIWIARDTDTPGRFLRNRISRVVPLYWFFTLLMAAILLVAPQLFKNTVLDLPTLLGSLFFWPHESSAHPGQLWPLVAPGWSLNYEMYFYALFAASMAFALRWRLVVVGVLLTIAFVAGSLWAGGIERGVSDTGGGAVGALAAFVSTTVVFEFVLGMALAVAYRHGSMTGRTLSVATAACLIVLGTSLLLLDLPGLHIVRYGLPAALVVAGRLYLPVPAWSLGELLGDASYALYLSHIFVLGALRVVLPPLLEPALGTGTAYAWSYVVIALLVCSVVGVAVHRLIDNWLLRRERLAMLRPSQPSVA